MQYRVGAYTVDAARKHVSRDGTEVVLPWRCFEALLLLVEAGGETVGREAFFQHLWPGLAVEESSLAKCISQLRRALPAAEGERELIETLPRVGYRLAAPVEYLANDISPDHLPTPAAPALKRSLWRALVIVVAVAVGAGWAWRSYSERQRFATAEARLHAAQEMTRKRDRESVAASIRLHQEAIAINPNYAAAYASLAQTMNKNLPFLGGRTPQEIVSIAERSVQLDPSCLSCRISYGFFLFYHGWRWSEAERQLREAQRMSGGDADSHANLAMLLAATGRQSEALSEIDKAIRISPYRAGWHAIRSSVLYFSGEYNQSILASQRAIALDSGYTAAYDWQSRAYSMSGRLHEGVRTLVPVRFAEHIGRLDAAYKRGGVQAELRELTDLTAGEAKRKMQCWRRDIWFTQQGEIEKALDEIEACYEIHNVNLAWIAVDPALQPLHEQPRFRSIVGQMGLQIGKNLSTASSP
ncbi:MAG: winged helix-turn-helix domain-containing protein [Acidobacteriota bacterium]